MEGGINQARKRTYEQGELPAAKKRGLVRHGGIIGLERPGANKLPWEYWRRGMLGNASTLRVGPVAEGMVHAAGIASRAGAGEKKKSDCGSRTKGPPSVRGKKFSLKIRKSEKVE